MKKIFAQASIVTAYKELVRLHCLASCISVSADSAIPTCRGRLGSIQYGRLSRSALLSCVASVRQIPTESSPPFAWPALPLKALNMSSAQNQIGWQGIVAAEKSISNGFIILQTSHLTCQLHKFESCIQSIAHNGVYPSFQWPAHAFWQAVEEIIETGWKENSHRCFSRGT